MTGGELSKINTIDFSGIDERIKNAHFVAACDVENPLCGENGASEVYGRQKGATDEDVVLLDNGLNHFAELVDYHLKLAVKDILGAGAAGGLGAGVMIFLNAKLQSGIEIVTKTTNLADKMLCADLVITGEGRIDYQTAFGKTPFGVAQIAKQKNIPVIALAGSLGKGYKTLFDKGFDGMFSIIDKPMSLEESIQNASQLVENAAEAIIRLWIKK
jgi:glycerate 2-kinase